MDRIIEAQLNGRTIYLNYSIDVMFAVIEKYNNIEKVFDALERDDKLGFETLRWLVIRMANDGELCRRQLGMDKSDFVSEADISIHISPYEYVELKAAVTEAIQAGYFREIPGDTDVDLGLAELNQKKTAQPE